jgi:hypothetical protein
MQHWSLAARADGTVDRACRSREERDHRRLVALADDPQRPVSSLEAEVFNVGGARLAHPASVAPEQDGQRRVLVVEPLGR